jgi:hypothetical protein
MDYTQCKGLVVVSPNLPNIAYSRDKIPRILFRDVWENRVSEAWGYFL